MCRCANWDISIRRGRRPERELGQLAAVRLNVKTGYHPGFRPFSKKRLVDGALLLYVPRTVRMFRSIVMAVLGCLLATAFVRAEKYETTTGQTLMGDPVSFNEKGVIIRQE